MSYPVGTCEIIIQARLHEGRGWGLTSIYLDRDGVELDRGEATHGLFPSSTSARGWFDQSSMLRYLRGRGIIVRWERARP